jgi:pyruvate/2-oxoglutarate dehydrogenase complex dihydrolipoamide dehydrogenase (E3) component
MAEAKELAMPTTHYDLVVIGSGQGGGPLAGASARAGKRTALIERVHVGGTCVNEGCTPTKTMVASARIAHLTRRAAAYGVDCGAVRVDLARVRERKQQMVTRFRSGSERSLERVGVEIIRGQARFVDDRRIEVSGGDGLTTLTADVIVINTGLRPQIPRLEGLDAVPYLTSTSIMELGDVPTHLIVVGGGYVGLEFAQMFRRFGSAVTILQRATQLLPREDADVASEIEKILRADGIEIYLSADTIRVGRDAGGVRLEYRQGPSSTVGAVSGSHVLVAAGRVPNTGDLDLGAAGVEVDERGYIRVNERLETSARGVFAIGDAKGGPAFTHISYDDFRILRTNLLQGGSVMTTGRIVPYTVFIDPQLGRVGMTQREAEAAGLGVKVAKYPMSSVARALEVDETQGFLKAIVEVQSGKILGAAVLSLEGGELAALFQIAMMAGLHYSALREGIFSHPTLAESLNNLFTAMDRTAQAV